MRKREQISATFQQHIRDRAGHLCEYCHTSEFWQYVPFTVDHILPLSQGGTNALENLCLACFHCNRQKSAHRASIDPLTMTTVPLFHPRQHIWNDHFIWTADCLSLIGLTAIGRATISLLELNRERVRRIRAADALIGRHPPAQDHIQSEE